MQLDLFSDNYRIILLNDADKMLCTLELKQALLLYEGLLNDAPDDASLLVLINTVASWHDRLSRFHAEPAGINELADLWQNLLPVTPPPLASALHELLIERLSKLPSPEMIYIPPRFHLGTIMMAASNFAEAEQCFAMALKEGINVRARFLAWQGDALTMLGETIRARNVYCEAFLEGPHEIDMEGLRSPMIHDLLFSLESANDESDEMDLLAWMPVWGWFGGEFGLRINEIAVAPEIFRAYLEETGPDGVLSVPRLWFNLLRYAEYLRTVSQGGRELVRIRRWMKQLNGFMFDLYMQKIRNPELLKMIS